MNRHERRAAAKRGQTPSGRAATVPAAAEQFAAGLAHHQAGRLADAEGYYRRALVAQPDHGDALNMLGVLAHQVGRSDIAVDLIRQAIATDAAHAGYFSNLGCAFQGQGKLDEAIAAFRQAISLDPRLAQARCNLGDLLRLRGQPDDAAAACREAIRLDPNLAEAHCNLGLALQDRQDFDGAVAAFGDALRARPDYAEALCNLGLVLSHQGKLEEAANALRQAIRSKPDFAAAHAALGIALSRDGKPDEAIRACTEALRLQLDHAAAYCALGNALYVLGRPEEAIAAYRHAVALRPDISDGEARLLFCLNYSAGASPAELFSAHRAWDTRHARALARPADGADRDADRRLRVGYVSPDFRSHSVAHFLEPLLRSHDRAEVEVTCYAEVNAPDVVTERFKQLADRWVPTVGTSDDALAAQIRDDGIDVLVDLAGHTFGNRLLAFARKPAPVQLTWLGYPNTTGLSAMDYRLVDAVTDPEGEADAFASETLVRLPRGFLCYDAPRDAPAPGSPPCLELGSVTFGSFNSPAKLSSTTLDAWAALLARVPTARLCLKGRAFADEGTRTFYLDKMRERGVGAKRIDLVVWVPEPDHLPAYGRIDIALDTFPYNGTTTTCEALWMGVPVVTLRGDRHAGRVGASLLTQVGLTDMIAGSVEDYVAIAAGLAGDPARLSDLRRSLRPRLAASDLCNTGAFARKIEAAYRTMWRQWCAAS
jgi:predicted O-linked N-acetylglucosamine transferase (SPINDLY family)